jgi:HlyD family secretion protein
VKEWISLHKKQAIAGAGVLIVLLAVLGIVLHQTSHASAAQGAATASATDQTNAIDAWGEVKYNKMEDISIDFPSVVTDVAVKEGDRVTLGQPLVTLDLSEYQGNLEKLKQQLSINQAALPAASQDPAALQADIAQTQSDIARKTKEYNSGTNADLKLLQNSLSLAQKEVADAKRDLQNYQSLYNAGAIPKSTLDQYTDALDQKQKAETDVEDNIQKTKTSLKDELDQLHVSLKSKQVQLAELNLGNTANVTKQQGGISSAQVDLNVMTAKAAKSYIKGSQIVSDLKNGIVQNIAVSDADHLGVQNAPTKVLQIIDADSITVSAEVDEEFISNVKLGETVKIVPTSAPDTSLTGTVTQIPNIAEEKDGKQVIRVLVKPQDPKNLLKPGYTADVYFPTK